MKQLKLLFWVNEIVYKNKMHIIVSMVVIFMEKIVAKKVDRSHFHAIL